MGDLTKKFSRKEFACKDGCGFDDINRVIVNFCQELRDYINQSEATDLPIRINSGCRCEVRNAQAGSTSLNHIHGNAADIWCRKGHIWLWNKAKELYDMGGLQGLQLCLLEGSWVHIDVDRPRTNGIFQKLPEKEWR